MVDIGTGLVILGGKEVLQKILGPTADYLGNQAKDYVEKSQRNIGKIFERTAKLLGPKLDVPGGVSPRVLKHIINEGSFCEDVLSSEYFGGVLASSRSEVPRDDRGVAIISLLASMSVYQIRTHYIFYSIFKELYGGEQCSVKIASERRKLGICIPFSLYRQCMDFKEPENPEGIIVHSLTALVRLELINTGWAFGSASFMQSDFCDKATESGIFFVPSLFGIELYMWVHGCPSYLPDQFLDQDKQFLKSSTFNIPRGSLRACRKEDR
jgi:hypothetical protein